MKWKYNISIPIVNCEATCNNNWSDESHEDKDIESSLEYENTKDVEVKEKKSSREKMKEMFLIGEIKS